MYINPLGQMFSFKGRSVPTLVEFIHESVKHSQLGVDVNLF